MNNSVLQSRLRPGRDPNDTSWVIQRYLRDWQAGHSDGVIYDSTLDALTLEPKARPEIAADWLPLAPVAGPNGTLFRADPERDIILHKKPCDDGFTRLRRVGGSGFATGQFNTPTGLNVDGSGRLYVADSGNSRVQVIDTTTGGVIAVLTAALVRPAHVAIAKDGRVFVADPGSAKIHVFDASFMACDVVDLATRDPWTDTLWGDDPTPTPLAIDILADGSLAIFDPRRPRLWHMTCDGRPLDAMAWPDASTAPSGWSPTPARFAARGETVVGPLDGATHDLAWHRILVDALIPEGCEIAVQTFASNTPDVLPINWAPKHPVPMQAVKAGRDDTRDDADFDRLVQASDDLWGLARAGRLIRARPILHRFDAPPDSDAFSLPLDVARQMQVGDKVQLTSDDGRDADFTVTAKADRPFSVISSGPQAPFSAWNSVFLIARDGRAPAYGPIDVGQWCPAVMPDLLRSGQVEQTALGHLLASILRVGDVLEFSGNDGRGRLEIIDVDEAAVSVTLDRAVEPDFAPLTLKLLDTPMRLVVTQSINGAGFVPNGNTLTLMDDFHSETVAIAMVDDVANTIWLTNPMTDKITPASWTSAEVAQPAATDRGRYLWVRLVMSGRPAPAPRDDVGPPRFATVSPQLGVLRITGPRPSMLSWLPAIFSERDPQFDAPGALFLERFLALFEGQFTRMEVAYESVSKLLNPRAADETWLDFLAAWMDVVFDPSWPIEQRRQLIIEGAKLQAAAGTPKALVRYLEIYTGATAAISEDFRNRPAQPMQLGARGALGIAALGQEDGPDRFAHQFSVRVSLPKDRDRAAALSAIHRIIRSMTPAHTTYRLDIGKGRGSRIGIDARVGGIFIPDADQIDPCLCDPDDARNPYFQTGRVPGGFQLGGQLGRGTISEFSHQGDPK